jgi:hypothetical protein
MVIRSHFTILPHGTTKDSGWRAGASRSAKRLPARPLRSSAAG